MQKRAQILKVPQSKRRAILVGSAIALAILIFVPWNMKLQGPVTVFPARRVLVASEVQGVVNNVYFREGAILKKGSVIASLENSEYRLALQQKQTQRDVLQKEISLNRSKNDSSSMGQHQIELDQVMREISYNQGLVDLTQIVSPVSGILITPKVEEKVGSLLKRGEQFCEVADMGTPRVEIDIPETDLGHVKIGQKVRVKMNAYPTKAFFGTVNLLGAQVTSQSPERYYRVEAKVENPDLLLKSGMVGEAKVEVGYHSIGYVLFRKPLGIIWQKLWLWLA